MPLYEYKVVPAPTKGRKGKGVRGAEARFSFAIQELMNEMASEGWEYQRAETLPSMERAGLSASTTEWRNVLVFRRSSAEDISAFKPELLPAPTDQLPVEIAPPTAPIQKPFIVASAGKKSAEVAADNGVEDHTTEDPDEGPGSALSMLARNRSVTKAG